MDNGVMEQTGALSHKVQVYLFSTPHVFLHYMHWLCMLDFIIM